MKMVVGLGNPGKEYENTRHNVGFMVVDNYCKEMHFSQKFNALYSEKMIEGNKIIFVKPLSFMNLSGTVVKSFSDYFKIKTEDILVIRDDLDLKIGKWKLKYDSSSGGDNGIKSIISYLGTQKFCQFKIGISNDKTYDTKDYVLGKFSLEEKKILSNTIELSKEVIDTFLLEGIESAMCKYNGMLK